jgi:hypothetical protein
MGEIVMRGEAEMTVPEVARVLGTRAALGIGLGLLIGNRLSEEQRRAVGWTLLLAGAYTAAALGLELFGRPRPFKLAFGQEQGASRSPSEPGDRLSQRSAFAPS